MVSKELPLKLYGLQEAGRGHYLQDVCNNHSHSIREKSTCTFHKDIKMIHPSDALMIDNFTNAEIIEIFHSFYDVMAVLPIIYPVNGVNREGWSNI